MRYFFIIALSLSCICAYPQNSIKVGKLSFKKIPEIFLNFASAVHPLKTRPRQSDDASQAVINSYTDRLLKRVEKLVRKKYEPLPLPDVETGFDVTIVLRGTGQIKLSNGQMKGLSKIYSGGKVALSYNPSTNSLTLVAPILFQQLSFTYNYSAKLLNLGPEGYLVGTFDDIKAQIIMDFDLNIMKASSEFKIISLGDIRVDLIHNNLINAVISVLTQIVTTTLQGIIRWVLDSIVGKALSLAVDTLNKEISKFNDLNLL